MAAGVERQRRAGQRAGAERRHVEPAAAVEQAVDVAGEGPAVGEQVVGEQRPAGPAAGACSRAGTGRRPPRPGRAAPPGAPRPATATAVRAPLGVEPQVGGHLVVAAPARVELGAGRTGQLGDPPLDRGVDVLVGRQELEGAARRAPPRPRRGRRARPPPPRPSGSRPGPGPRTWAREPARSSGASRWSNGRLTVKASSSSAGPLGEAAVPEGGHRLAAQPALGARPGLDGQAPEPDEAGGVLVAERVLGVVGGQAVVVEAVRAAPPGDLARARATGAAAPRR